MTEVEKLRALLAEALGRVGLFCDDDLRQRIDAALAEPVQEDEALRVWKMVATQKQAERDEARAEVQAAIDAILLRGGYNEAQRQGRSLIQLVGQLGHDLLNVRGALNDYKHVHERTTRERDEARAALEKEKAAHQLEKEAHDLRFDRETKRIKERDEARAEVAVAYQRGAEAMREAAARRCEISPLHGFATTVGAAYADAIRALPVPEDKS